MSIMRSNIARQFYNTGGITNLINTYQNNPTLQSQMTQEEYLDLFNSQPTPTNTIEQIIQSSTSPTIESPIVKRPILPIIPEGDGGGGGTGPKGFDKGFSSANFGLGPNKDVVDYEAEAYGIGRTPLGTASAIITGIPSLSKMAFQFAKGAKDKTKKMIEDYFARKAEEERIRQEQLANAAELARRGTGAYITQDSFGGDYGQRAGGGSFSGKGASTDITATEGSS